MTLVDSSLLPSYPLWSITLKVLPAHASSFPWCFLLTKLSISRSELNKAYASLTKFVKGFQELYGDVHMIYNVHQLNHLTQTVIDWGPLLVYSTYGFEGLT